MVSESTAKAPARHRNALSGILPGVLRAPSSREALTFYFCVLPWIVGFLAFTAGPMLFSLVLTFTRWNMLTPLKFVGVQNFSKLLTADRLFWKSLGVTAYYSFASVPLNLMTGFLLAILLNQGVKGLSVYRTVFYLPSVVSGVAVALLWAWVFNPQYGVLNGILAAFGIRGPLWIYSEEWVIPSLIMMSLWGVGGSMLVYLGGLQGIPTELYEAAEIDGAGRFSRFRHVTVPMMTPVIFFSLVMGIIGSFQVFTQAFIMTEGGPNNASLFYVLYLYRNAFQYFQMGYASALAWILFVIIMVLTLAVFRSSSTWVFYQGELRGVR